MARSFKPGVLVTVSAGGLLACSGLAERIGGTKDGDEIHGNPPPTHTVSFPGAPFSVGQSLEAHDEQGREIHHGGGSCWVDLPFPEPPTSVIPPPTHAVPCPDAIQADPAFADCAGGSVHLASLSPLACVCYFNGNPPPSPKDVACPVTAIPGLARADVPPPTNPPGPGQ